MALMYSWATKEYLLWEMTIGQIFMYNNKGIELKYGIAEPKKTDSLLDKSVEELRKMRDDFKAQNEDPLKSELRAKYGDIDG